MDITVKRVQGWSKANINSTIFGVFIADYDGRAKEYKTLKGAAERVRTLLNGTHAQASTHGAGKLSIQVFAGDRLLYDKDVI